MLTALPAAGETPPDFESVKTNWLQTIEETRDAASNLVQQAKPQSSILTSAVGRARMALCNH